MTLDRRRIPKSIHSASARPVHGSRCATVDGVLGCETTGWQDQAEMTDTVIDEINHDSRFEKHVQATWKNHARRMPVFIPVMHQVETYGKRGFEVARSHFDDLVIVTQCAASSPFWDPKRTKPSSSRRGTACRLFTMVGFEWEFRP